MSDLRKDLMDQLLFDKTSLCSSNQTIISNKLICMNILKKIIFIGLQSCLSWVKFY